MTRCKCGKEVVEGVTFDGKKVKLDPSIPVYALINMRGVTEAVRSNLSMSVHECKKPGGSA